MDYSSTSLVKKRSLTVVPFVMFLSVMLLWFIASSAQASAQPALGDTAADQPVSVVAPTIASSRSSTQDINAVGYWAEERMLSARPAKLVSEPS